MDVLIDLVVEGKRYLIAIEDKVSSNEHNNQLQTYSGKLSNKGNINYLVELGKEHNEDTQIQFPNKYQDMALIYYKTNKMSYDNEFKESGESKNV